MALVGMANSLAIEGCRYNIHINAITPIAHSPLTENLLAPELLKILNA